MKALLDELVQRGVLNTAAAERAFHGARRSKKEIGEVLIELGLANDTEICEAHAATTGIPLGNVDEILETLDRRLVRAVARPFLRRGQMIPVSRTKRSVKVAIANPAAPYSDVAQVLGVERVEPVLISASDLRRIWAILALARPDAPEPEVDEEEILGDADFESRMVSLFEALILDAIGSRASDIHLELYEGRVRVRYRIDGGLHDVRRFDISELDHRGIINVIKIGAKMDITERRLPQGGRMRRRAGDQVYDLRVQTQPSLHGEHVVIRLLHQDQRQLTIEELGFAPEDAGQFRRMLDSPQGMVLVVGPTGSGKSTTLYAGLGVLSRDESRKVITVEDPIEYAIVGVQQTQVHSAIGFAFADAMRVFVREDPDVILVGEIRDSETALEAIRASQTGHLVLSTLHCNDAVDAVQRLRDLNMHPNSIASELVAIISQRLVRRICTRCREPDEPDPKILRELFPDAAPQGFRCFIGRGCDYCGGRGTIGRIATFEFLRVDETIRFGISRNMTVDELRHLAHDAGLKPIRNHLVELVLSGVTPLSEVPRTLSVEQMAPVIIEDDIGTTGDPQDSGQLR